MSDFNRSIVAFQLIFYPNSGMTSEQFYDEFLAHALLCKLEPPPKPENANGYK